MIAWVSRMLKKYREIIMYLVFGVLTTAVNWAVDYPLYYFAQLPATVCTIIAWAVAVLFAFFTNKPFVFQSKDWSLKVAGPEFIQFVSCRIGSGLLDMGFMYLTDDVLNFNHIWTKILSSVFVVIINYIGGKLLFKKSKD